MMASNFVVILLIITNVIVECYLLDQTEFNALKSLYDATNGPSWKSSCNDWIFTTNDPTLPCTNNWHGITCECSYHNPCTLIRLFLYDCQLSGSIPTEIGLLTGLEEVYLEHNRLSNTIPTEIGLLANLKFFYSNTNKISGVLPTHLGLLANLEAFDSGGCSLTGKIPTQIGLLTNLKQLLLGVNHITSSIPTEIGLVTALRDFRIAENSLIGSLPNAIKFLTRLETFDIYNNRITGLMQTVIPLLSNKMIYLELSNNQLEGYIPTEIGLLTDLTDMFLGGNKLQGTIPVDVKNLIQIKVFDVQDNQISGTIPAIGQLTDLRDLWISSNKIGGNIPNDISLLSKLRYLELSDNQLSGTLPNLSNIYTLKSLHVARNKLQGPCPSLLSNNMSIKSVILSHNSLTGNLNKIVGGVIFPNLVSFDITSTSLTGTLPSSIFIGNKLEIFAAATNCLEGSLPKSICNASVTLKTLILDGMVMGANCVKFIYPDRKDNPLGFDGVISDHDIVGGIPECIFTLPALHTLHVAGNGFTGTLPNTITSSIQRLSVSYNSLEGTIPSGLWDLQLEELDLSHNKLSGTVHDNDWNMESFINLKNNRLSGSVPTSMKEFKNISILEGNIFGCSDSAELPQNDPYLDKFNCGSDVFNQNMILFACAFIVVIFATFALQKYHALIKMVFSSISAIDDYVQIFKSSVIAPKLVSFAKTLTNTRQFTALVTILVLLLIPIYSIIKSNHALTTYNEQYGWSPTAAFLSGNLPSIVLLIFWIVIITITLDRITVIFGNHSAMLSFSDIAKIDLKIWVRYLALIFIISSINAVFVVSANIAYGVALRVGSNTVQNAAGVVLAFFKIFWNSSAITLMRQYRLYLDEDDYNSCMSVIFGSDVIFFTLIMVFNNIIAPIVATLLDETNCFKNALYAPDPIISTYEESLQYKYVLGKNRYIDKLVTHTIEFTPPFKYNYSCSSFVLIHYVPVFVIAAIVPTFLKPVKDYFYLRLNSYLSYGYNQSLLRACSRDTSIYSHSARALRSRLQLLNRLPKLLWSFEEREFAILANKLFSDMKGKDKNEAATQDEKKNEEEKREIVYENLCGYSVMMILSILNVVLDFYNSIFNDIDTDDEANLDQIIDFEPFVSTMLSNLFILLTFGLMCPLLAIATATSILFPCYYLQFLIGRYIAKIQEINLDENNIDAKSNLMSKLEKDCDGHLFEFSISQIRFTLMFLSSLFMAAFLFDITGDRIGWKGAIVFPFVLIGVTVVVMISQHLLRLKLQSSPKVNKVYVVSIDDDVLNKVDSNATIIKDDTIESNINV